MQRLLTHSSSPTVWLEECRIFYDHLRNRGYPVKAIDASYSSINWNQRRKMLEPKIRTKTCDDASSLGTAAAFSQIETRRERTFFGALLTSRSTSCEPPALNGTTYSRQVPSSQYGALSRWETFYDGDLLAISMGPLQSVPKIVGIPVPVVTPVLSSCKSDARWAPFKLS